MRIVLVLLLVAGCFGDDDGDGSNYVTVEQMGAAYKDALCTYYARCGLFPDQATCVGANVPALAVDPNLISAVHAGRVIFKGNDVKACFDAMADATCDETDANGRIRPGNCNYYVEGTVGGGEACVLDEECISQRCSGGMSGMTCQMGTCLGDTAPVTEPVAIGMPCTSLTGCVVGAYCDLSGVCVELKRSGIPCNANEECTYGFGCVGTTGTRTCERLPAKGEPCPAGVCRDFGTYCSSQSATCQPMGLPSAPCTSNDQCSLFYTCDVTNTRTCVQTPGIGQSCRQTLECFPANSFCDSTSGTYICTATRADGQMCANDGQCQTDNCDVNSGLCSTPLTCF
jgi:hypothetical protein